MLDYLSRNREELTFKPLHALYATQSVFGCSGSFYQVSRGTGLQTLPSVAGWQPPGAVISWDELQDSNEGTSEVKELG